jgi:hypothetical protein
MSIKYRKNNMGIFNCQQHKSQSLLICPFLARLKSLAKGKHSSLLDEEKVTKGKR